MKLSTSNPVLSSLSKEEKSIESLLFQRMRSSVISYGIRQVAVVLLTLTSNIVLTRFLMPGEYGKVAAIMVVINTAVLLADGGLGVYLIQRHAEVSQNDLSRMTLLQLYMALFLSMICFIAAASFSVFHEGQLVWMIAAASLSLPLLVVRGMALLLLERSVQIRKVVKVEVLEESIFAILAISLALSGWGAWSIVAAQISKALVGCMFAVWIGEFRFRILPVLWDSDFSQGLRFGLQYQAAQMINMARISINPLFIIPVLGFQAGGFVERAWYFSGAALSIILAVQKRVIFPYVARVQKDLEKVRLMLESSVYISAALDKLLFLPLIIFTREIVLTFFGEHWLPMVPLIHWLLAGNILFGAMTGPLYPVASGIGRADILFRFNLVSFFLSWLLIVPLTWFIGIEGVGVAGFLLWGMVHWLRTKIIKEIGPFSYYRQTLKPLTAFGISWLLMELLLKVTGGLIYSLFVMVLWSLLACLIYCIVFAIFDWRYLAKLWAQLYTTQEVQG